MVAARNAPGGRTYAVAVGEKRVRENAGGAPYALGNSSPVTTIGLVDSVAPACWADATSGSIIAGMMGAKMAISTRKRGDPLTICGFYDAVVIKTIQY